MDAYIVYGVMLQGEPAASFHNKYPQAWGQLTAEALSEAESEGIIADKDEIVYFMRSAWTNSPASAPVFW